MQKETWVLFGGCFSVSTDLRKIRNYCTHEAATVAGNAIVGSHLVYCNLLHTSLSNIKIASEENSIEHQKI